MIKFNNRYIKVGLLFFVFLLVLVEGIQMVFGYRLKTGKEHDPFTWSEIYESLQNSLPHIERARKDLLLDFLWKLYWRYKKLH